VELAQRNRGLGLVSMQERVYLMHGTLSVESQPGKGTKILAVAPLVAENGNSSMDRMGEDEQVKVASKDDRLLATTR
jgi:signal transduction histidine kinase